MVRLFMAAVAVAGCAKVSDQFVEPPGFKLGISVTDSAGVISVTVPNAVLEFAPETQVRLPQRLVVDGGTDLLGGAACPFEDRVGVAIYPFAQISASVKPSMATLVTEMPGPAVVRLRSDYEVRYMACGTQQVATGYSWFTLFPSGRINRADWVQPVAATLIDPAMCSTCSAALPNDSVFFTSFWRFRDVPAFVDANDQVIDGNNVAPVGCVRVLNKQVGVAWSNTDGAQTRIANQAYITDWEHANATSLSPTERHAVSNVIVSGAAVDAPCAAVTQQLLDPDIDINGITVSAEPDGIYNYDRPENRLELTAFEGAVEHGFPLRLRVQKDAIRHLRVYRSTGDIPYVLQSDGDTTLVWIHEPLPANDPIILEHDG